MKAHHSRILAIFAFSLALSSHTSPAAAVLLMCQARASTSSHSPPYQVSFRALVAQGELPYGFHWDFGDGRSSNEQDPFHTYTQNGFYSAILTVSDSGDPETVCRDTVRVLLGVFVDPFCGATASIRWGDAPLAVDFFAYPALVGDPEPYTWSWRFGDGETGSGQTTTHAYDVGTYWAVATLHTPQGTYDCLPTLRISAIPGVTGVALIDPGPALRLEPPRPNPFGVMTVIGFELPRPGRARLVVLDLGGRKVATLVDGSRSSGRHFEVWQGRGSLGREAPAGLYFARLEHDGVARSIRMVRLP